MQISYSAQQAPLLPYSSGPYYVIDSYPHEASQRVEAFLGDATKSSHPVPEHSRDTTNEALGRVARDVFVRQQLVGDFRGYIPQEVCRGSTNIHVENIYDGNTQSGYLYSTTTRIVLSKKYTVTPSKVLKCFLPKGKKFNFSTEFSVNCDNDPTEKTIVYRKPTKLGYVVGGLTAVAAIGGIIAWFKSGNRK